MMKLGFKYSALPQYTHDSLSQSEMTMISSPSGKFTQNETVAMVNQQSASTSMYQLDQAAAFFRESRRKE